MQNRMTTEPSAEQRWPEALPSSERQRMVRITRRSWRELGFWYGCDPAAKCWTFRADRDGVRRFALLIRQFARLPDDPEQEDHVHLGPFSHLRLMHGERPILNAKGIAGRPGDLDEFAGELEALAAEASPGVHPFAAAFAADQGFLAVLVLEADGFDPASADHDLRAEPEN